MEVLPCERDANPSPQPSPRRERACERRKSDRSADASEVRSLASFLPSKASVSGKRSLKKLCCLPPKTVRQRAGQGGRSEQASPGIFLYPAPVRIGRALLFNTVFVLKQVCPGIPVFILPSPQPPLPVLISFDQRERGKPERNEQETGRQCRRRPIQSSARKGD